MSRRQGFYWVKFGGDWIPAEWAPSYRCVVGSAVANTDEQLSAIGPRLEPPK